MKSHQDFHTFFLQKPVLLMSVLKSLVEKSNYKWYNYDKLIQRLATYQNGSSSTFQRTNSQPPIASSVQTTLLKRIIQSAFMPRLLFILEEIYRVGLVGRQGRKYAKASCDFIENSLLGWNVRLVLQLEQCSKTVST
jgi:hypothetical protein